MKQLRTTLVIDNMRLPAGSSEGLARSVAREIAKLSGLDVISIKVVLATPGRPDDYWRALVRVQPPE